MIPFATAERAHAGDRIARPLTDDQAATIDTVVQSLLGFRVRPATDVFGVVHLHPAHAVSTRDEVRVLRAMRAVTDSPLAWHSHPGDLIWGVTA